MQAVTILRGGIHYYHNAQGEAKDCYVVYPHESIEHLRQWVGSPLHTLGHFPDVDNSLIVRDMQIRDNNIVAYIEGKIE